MVEISIFCTLSEELNKVKLEVFLSDGEKNREAQNGRFHWFSEENPFCRREGVGSHVASNAWVSTQWTSQRRKGKTKKGRITTWDQIVFSRETKMFTKQYMKNKTRKVLRMGLDPCHNFEV